MAYWHTYSVPSWEIELDQIEDAMDLEYRLEEQEKRDLDNYKMWLFDQKMDFYEDLGNVGGTFTKFFYNVPHPSTEAVWCTPNFNCCDPMGLFYRYVDVQTFNILMFDIFKMRGTAYRPWGHQQYEYDTLKVLFQFAERWCAIHGLSDEESSDYNYKLTLWVVSRIMLYLND